MKHCFAIAIATIMLALGTVRTAPAQSVWGYSPMDSSTRTLSGSSPIGPEIDVDLNAWSLNSVMETYSELPSISHLFKHSAALSIDFWRRDVSGEKLHCVFMTELDVDGQVVEQRSCDLKHVWYAHGWNSNRVDEVVRYLWRTGMIDERKSELQ